ncbi:hypothetical protein DFS34DRAFT_512396 [Phlyctochytrium arcticum]|nr:hypothetical protein DFS34DRAFT_512396 [Phlyctochytrium arcticum]
MTEAVIAEHVAPNTALLILSRFLGSSILLLGSILKIPSLLPILRTRSTRGVPILPILLEIYGLTISIVFNIRASNPFTTWGETPCLLVADLLICAVHWQRRPLIVLLPALVLYVHFFRVLSDPSRISESSIQLLLGSTVPAFMGGTVVQILENYHAKHIGAISPATLSMGLFCGLGRMVTTLVEVDDPVAHLSAVVGAVLGVVLFWQMISYKDNTRSFLLQFQKKSVA